MRYLTIACGKKQQMRKTILKFSKREKSSVEKLFKKTRIFPRALSIAYASSRIVYGADDRETNLGQHK